MLNSKQQATSTVVAKINNIPIFIVNNGTKRVPINPICELLGLDFSGQNQKLKKHPILGLVVGVTPTTGADGKTYEMTTIPLKYIFGYLFTIQIDRVKPEAREAVIKYQNECYDALFSHFIEQAEFLQLKEELTEGQLEIVKDRKRTFNTAKKDLLKAEKDLIALKDYTIEDWREDNMVQKIPFTFDQENKMSNPENS